MNFYNGKYFFSKHLSWLEFNKRVLEEAQSENTPLLEKLKYISITMSNLDEFVMVRLGRVKDKVANDYSKTDKAGNDPEELYHKMTHKIHKLMNETYHTYKKLNSQLEENNIIIKNFSELNTNQEVFVSNYFKEVIHPILTPMAVDKSRPFPHLANQSLNIAVLLESDNEENEKIFKNKKDQELLAFVQVPSNLNRFVELPNRGLEEEFIMLEDIIKAYIYKLFTGYKIIAQNAFRLTRNADINIEYEKKNLLLEMEEYVKRRRWGFPVRLEIEKNMHSNLKELIITSLAINEEDIYEIPGTLDLSPLLELYNKLEKRNLKFDKIIPQPVVDFYEEDNYYEIIKDRDVLLSHPYESFTSVVKFVENAAKDPDVLAIKMSLYRVSGDSPIIKALSRAADNGKQATVLVELKARFDEEQNIEWAKQLEKAGCHVIYGLEGLKVHAKALLVVRAESDGIQKYVHMSTGNYNDRTAKLYTDVGFFTTREDIALDVSKLFNILTGYSAANEWKSLAVAPKNLKSRFIDLIENEIEQINLGKEGYIIAKMNGLTDNEIIKKLYEASKTGVKIDLIVRGICCLRPQVRNLSENIKVISIVGKLLEHNRIYYFNNGDKPRFFLTSADWRTRNLDRRVEVLFEVEQDNLKDKLKTILDISLKDNVKARELQPDGTYKVLENNLKEDIESQLVLYELAKERLKEYEHKKRTASFK